MRVIVVGATGNVGTAVLRRLLDEPDVTDIMGVARRVPQAGAGSPYDQVRWSSYDVGLAGNTEPLADVFRGADAVIHLAWQIQPSHQRALLRRTNVQGSEQVAEACGRAGVPKLVYASSVGTYAPGPKDRMVDESWPATGISGSTYSEDKAAVEALLDDIESRHSQLTVVRLRPGLIFQADAASEILRYFAGPLAPAALLRYGRLPLVPYSSELRTQAVHADDVADAYVRALTYGTSGAFNVAASPVLDGRVVAQHFHGRTVPVSPALLGRGADLTWRMHLQPVEQGWVRMGQQAPLMDCGKVEKELGWKPSHDAISALRELLLAMGHTRGANSPVLREREPPTERFRAIVRGRAPGHGSYY